MLRTDENFNAKGCDAVTNQRGPIIAIVAQETYSIDENYLSLDKNGVDKSFVAASYVKFLKECGAQVVFIMIRQSDEYYEKILSQVHGVLFPGGATWLHEKDGYGDAGKIIYKIALERKIPIFAICLGMHLLSYADSGDADKYRSKCDHKKNKMLPLNLTSDFQSSKLFKEVTDKIIELLKNKNLNCYSHQYCITEKNLEDCQIRQNWRVVATETDEKNDTTYISAMESVNYPIWGIQFHPEKLCFESTVKMLIPEDEMNNAEKNYKYFGEFFVKEAENYMKQSANENRARDLKFSDSYTSYKRPRDKGAYDEIYVFDIVNSI